MSSQPLRKETPETRVLPFRKSYYALAEAQAKRQSLHRLRLQVMEVGLVTAGGMVLAILSGTALLRFVPYQLSQEQKLREISQEVITLQAQVESLRARLPERFGTGQLDSGFLRRHGWLRPGQFVVKFLPAEHNRSRNQ